MFEIGTPRVKVHPERQPESFTKEELYKRLTDLETILSNSDGSEPVKYDETASEWLLLTQLMKAKIYPKLELDYLIKHKELQIKQNKEGPPSFRKGPLVESLLEKQLADLMKEKKSREKVSQRDFFMQPAGAAGVADSDSSDGEGEVFGSLGSSRSSSDENPFGDGFGGKKSMNLKKSKPKSKSKSRKSRRKSRKSRRKSRKSRRKSRILKSKY